MNRIELNGLTRSKIKIDFFVSVTYTNIPEYLSITGRLLSTYIYS